MKRFMAILAIILLLAPVAMADKAVTIGAEPYYEIRDQDAMTADSATSLATQQSIKAYVDSGTVTMTNKTLTNPTVTTGTFTTPALTTPTITNPTTSFDFTSKTTAYTVTAADLGKVVFDNKGDTDGDVTLTLPSLTAAMEGKAVRVMVYAAATVNIDVATGDQILALTNAAADKIQNTGTAGNWMTLIARDLTYWVSPSHYGTWSDAN